MIDSFLKICGAISVVSATLVLLYKGYRHFLPVKASISYTLKLDGRGSDSLAVTITNRSDSPVYVRTCRVRCTYSILDLVLRHIRNPFLSPRLYPNLRYNSVVYELIGKAPLKFEPGELIELRKDIYEHPLNALHGPMLIAFVELTNGRVVRSNRVPSPTIWRMIGRRNRVSA